MALMIVLAGLSIMMLPAGNPLWQSDRYVLEGAFTGASCSLMLDGRPIVGDTAFGSGVLISRNTPFTSMSTPGYAINEVPPDQSISCRGLTVTIKAPPLTHTSEGSYGIVERSLALGPGLAIVEFSSDDVGPSWWPFALAGTKLVAHEGALTITTMTDSTMLGTFRVVARRHDGAF